MPHPQNLRLAFALFWLHPRRPEWSSRWFQLGRIVSLLAYAYVALGVAMILFEDELVFRPKPYPQFWSAPPKKAEPLEFTLSLDGDQRVHVWWFEPPGWTPVRGAMLHCHGHGCNLSHLGDRALDWRDLFGRGVLLFDYPGFGKSTGRCSEEGCYASAEAAFDWLRRTKEVGDVVVYGHSLGGAVAVDLARRRPVRAVIVTSSFTSMPDAARALVRVYPTSWLMHNSFDSVLKIADCTAPVFIAHGADDGRIPAAQGRQLFDACGSARKHFHIVDGAGHGLEHDMNVMQAAKRFVDSCPLRDR